MFLRGLHEQLQAGFRLNLLRQPGDHLPSRHPPDAGSHGFKIDVKSPIVALLPSCAGAKPGRRMRRRRGMGDDVVQFPCNVTIRWNDESCAALGNADDQPDVLRGKESCGMGDEQKAGDL